MAPQTPSQQRNPKTEAAHRKETWWQITVPLAAGAVLVIVLAVLAGMASASQGSKWADTALIFLIALSFVPLFIALALGAAAAYGLWEANRRLPSLMLRAQEFAAQVDRSVRKASEKIAAPIIKGHALSAKLRALRRRIPRLGP